MASFGLEVLNRVDHHFWEWGCHIDASSFGSLCHILACSPTKGSNSTNHHPLQRRKKRFRWRHGLTHDNFIIIILGVGRTTLKPPKVTGVSKGSCVDDFWTETFVFSTCFFWLLTFASTMFWRKKNVGIYFCQKKKFDIKVTARLILLLICWFFFLSKASFWFLAWIIKRIVMKTYCCIKESERSFLTLEKRQFSPLSTFFFSISQSFSVISETSTTSFFHVKFSSSSLYDIAIRFVGWLSPNRKHVFYRLSYLEWITSRKTLFIINHSLWSFVTTFCSNMLKNNSQSFFSTEPQKVVAKHLFSGKPRVSVTNNQGYFASTY